MKMCNTQITLIFSVIIYSSRLCVSVKVESLHVESGQIRILTTKRRGGQAVSPFFTVFFLRSRTGEIDLLKTSPKNNYINRSDKFGKPSLIAVTLNHRKAA